MSDLSLPVRLVTQLNAMAAGVRTAPEAEAHLRFDERPHHVLDADAQFTPDAETVTLRRALGWMAAAPAPNDRPVAWALLLPGPGHLAGLRGPAPLNQAAVERGAVVVRHDGTVAWLCDEVGHGVQWTLLRAERIAPPDDPRSASRALMAVTADVTGALAGAPVAGERPDERAPHLGRAYPATSQVLFDRAWLLWHAARNAGESAASATTSHQALQRERALRPLGRASADALSAAVSWPGFAMVE